MGSSNIGRGRLGREGRGGGYPAFQFGQVEPKGNGNLTIRGLLIRGKVADNSGHPRRGRPRGCRPQLSGARGDGTRQTPSTRMPVEQVPRGWFALSIAPNLASPPSLRPRPTSNFQQLNSIPPQFRGQPAQRARQGPVPRSIPMAKQVGTHFLAPIFALGEMPRINAVVILLQSISQSR